MAIIESGRTAERLKPDPIRDSLTPWPIIDGVVASLLEMIGLMHPETLDHSHRVAMRAEAVARLIGLSAEEVRAIRVAGLLHDVGKVTIDSRLLDKPGALEPHEMDEIRKHPGRSQRIVASVPLPRIAVDAIRHHHERFDGNGYPDRLEGEGIQPSARGLCACDA